MKDIKDLKADYDNLSRQEKGKIGESLVKVNLGFGLPEDLKRVASFLKGSFFIAKEATLEPVINALHEAEASPTKDPPNQTQILVSHEIELNKTRIRNLSSFDEDSEVTQKDKV
ncbi:MAG: hypothetical protein ACD_73C00241G0002 [uncultured bacterium]|nr:MAG: hypothetical protein ACD_73C00241G0002 [uncultured bacterium]